MGSVFTPVRRKLSVQAFHALGQAGYLTEDDRVELIEGEMIEMAPIGSRHAWAVDTLSIAFARAMGDRAHVSHQNPLVLSPETELQPDIMLLRSKAQGYGAALPTPEDVLLIVEVADSSAPYDREVKLPLYAKHNIPELWIVDLQHKRLEVYREPAASGYQQSFQLGSDEAVGPAAFPSLRLEWGKVLE
jgi:Uma2 family endonuclease